ncbi:multidrug effflux MFS transporter [Jiella sp. MQZ9-1]|uniref:Bcr/CflA family efflux transporter n=1 Tax=Jiella flava TaxID=2816857 RepID=A0A939JW74_9HYPH|nr:multidrug effflux MFS transporter [Jiella flava]MBO0662752.1 multidrug effflux MFS transporter [Jiella flava]MCD2471174.1 multidrug effflux MFS transporter [Jiella flava]
MAQPAQKNDTHGLPYWELVTLVACLMAMNAAAIDIFIPALQDIGSALGVTDANQRQLVITAYLLGFGGGQIVYGPVSDRFGRRRVLLFGIAVYVLAVGWATVSTSFAMLLALRAIQGIGAAATRVIAVSVVRDCFGGRRMASVMSLVMMVFMAIPVIAPNIGQGIMLFGTWREIFIVVALFGAAVALWTAIRLPETLAPENRRELTGKRIAEAFRIVLTNRIAFGYTIATAMIFGVLFGFINQAEQLYTQVYQLGPYFTLAFSATAICMALASFMNSRLVETFGMRRLSHGALIAFTAIAVLHLAVAWACGGQAPIWFFIPIMTLNFCIFGFIGTNFNALAMDPLGHVAGTASAVLGFMQTFGGGIFGAIIGYFYNGTVIPLLVGFILLSTISTLCVYLAEGRLFDPKYDDVTLSPQQQAEQSAAE